MQTPWNKGWTLIQNFCIKHLITGERVLHTIWTLTMLSALVCCEQNIWCIVQSTMLSPTNYGSQSFVTLCNNHFDSTLSNIKYWLWSKIFWMLDLDWCKSLVVFTKLSYLSINQVTCSFPIDKCCRICNWYQCTCLNIIIVSRSLADWNVSMLSLITFFELFCVVPMAQDYFETVIHPSSHPHRPSSVPVWFSPCY